MYSEDRPFYETFTDTPRRCDYRKVIRESDCMVVDEITIIFGYSFPNHYSDYDDHLA